MLEYKPGDLYGNMLVTMKGPNIDIKAHLTKKIACGTSISF